MNVFKVFVFAILVSAVGVSGAAAMSSTGAGPKLTEFDEGFAFVKAKDFVNAEARLKAAVEKLPSHVDSWSLLGFVSRKNGKTDDAFEYYQKALELDDEFLPALNYLGHLYLETGQLEKAKAMLDRLDSACFFGCPEYDDLRAAVAAGKSGKY